MLQENECGCFGSRRNDVWRRFSGFDGICDVPVRMRKDQKLVWFICHEVLVQATAFMLVCKSPTLQVPLYPDQSWCREKKMLYLKLKQTQIVAYLHVLIGHHRNKYVKQSQVMLTEGVQVLLAKWGSGVKFRAPSIWLEMYNTKMKQVSYDDILYPDILLRFVLCYVV